MINYSQRTEEKDGMKIYYFSFYDSDIDIIKKIIKSDLRERLSAISVAIAKDTNIRIKMPYWTDDNAFYKEFRWIVNSFENDDQLYGEMKCDLYEAYGGIFKEIFGG